MNKASLLCMLPCLAFTGVIAQQSFTTFQPANLVIGQTTFTGYTGLCAQNSTNNPSCAAISAKGVLAIGDQAGWRVNLWKSPITQNGQLPDIVVGQSIFTDCSGGLSQTKMLDPEGVAFSPDGNKLIVSDGYNARVLIWNTIPTTNGQPADVVIGQPDFTTSNPGIGQSTLYYYPTGLFVTPDGKLLVTDIYNQRVLIWNTIPTRNGQPADVVVGQKDFTSYDQGDEADQLDYPSGVCVSPDGKLLIVDGDNNRVLIFNTVPTTNGASADVVVGHIGFGTSSGGVSANQMFGPEDVKVAPDGKMVVTEYSNNRVLIFNSVPTANNASADVVLGQPDFTTNTILYPSGLPDSKNMERLYTASFDLYGRLFVVDRRTNRVTIFGSLPTAKAELGITMKATASSICSTTAISSVVTIVNNGPDVATNVVATSSLPVSFVLNTYTVSKGTYNRVSGYWNIPSISPGDSAVLTISGNASIAGSFNAYANIVQSNQLDVNLENNGTNVVYTVAAGQNCLFTDSVSPALLCAGTSATVAYTKAGTFNAGNIFTAELSDALGSFANPIAIGSSASTTNGTISVSIPTNMPFGSYYRIRVKSSIPAVIGTDNNRNITIVNKDSIVIPAPILNNMGRKLAGSSSFVFSQYQWYQNNVIIPNVTSNNYYASSAGTYNVSYLSGCGNDPKSNPINFNANSQPQTINFPVIPTKTYTDSFIVPHAIASSLLPITYTVISGPGNLLNDTTIKITGVGAIVLSALQAGNNIYDSAVSVKQSINIAKGSQTIKFPTPLPIPIDGNIYLGATTSSGLFITYSIVSGPGTISNTSSYGYLHITGTGLITVRASQSGDLNYDSAADKVVTLCIPPTQPGAIIGSTQGCTISDSAVAYSVANITGANFIWSIDGGGILTSSGNNASVKWTSLGNHTIAVKYTADCGVEGPASTLNVSVFNQTIAGAFANLLPVTGNMNIDLPLSFSWFPVTNALTYDLYLWPDTAAARPATPIVSGINTINYTLYNSSLLEYGNMYKWQVVAKSACDQLASPILTFRMRYLPDLIVNNIQVPASGFSGQSLSINWEVKNIGTGATLNQQWVDQVYLSKDTLLDGQDIVLGATSNVSELATMASYTRTASFVLPQGTTGNYHAIIVTNPYDQLKELSYTNNTRVSVSTLAIQLTPPPDLQVTSIVPPNFAFSGQDINVNWTVKNLGTGSTVASIWSDAVYLSKNPVFNKTTALYMGDSVHRNALGINESYNNSATCHLPDTAIGAYYIYVITDSYNQVYEFSQENNNTLRSDSIHVVLTPPIDLVVKNITQPQKASNLQTVTIGWRVENQGGSSTENKSWTDEVYLYKKAVFDKDSAILLGRLSNPTSLAQGAGYDVQKVFTIPQNITGPYYVYVKTNANNGVYEYTYANNDITKSILPINVVSPDLIVSNVAIPPADTSGHLINIAWTIKNNDSGTLFADNITDRILLSSSPFYSAANAIELKQFNYDNIELAAGAVFTNQTTVKLPNGISGTYYAYVQTDYTNKVYETLDNNNTGSSNPIRINLSPWPDLQVLAVQTNSLATAGDIIPLAYTITNKGIKTVDDSSWTDKIFLSKKTIWDSASSVYIHDVTQSRIVAKDSSYTINTTIKVPVDLADTIYSVYVYTDANNNVYEHIAEGNNTGHSAPIHIKKYPPVDLVVTAIAAPASGMTGAPIKVKWTVANSGQATTLQSQWSDALYLSADTVWDANDRLVSEFLHPGILIPGASYTNEQNFTLPNGIAGSYYLLLVTDRADVNNDANRSNNYKLVKQGADAGPTPIVITLTNPPDLIVANLGIPNQGTAGQPINVNWTVNNIGVGPTVVNTWTEKIYLSTNLLLDASDRLIGSYTHTGGLNPGSGYSDSLQVFLPIDVSGNYILIFKADANDNVYENGAEDNTAFIPITIVKAPFSDLVVNNIQAPAMAMAGDTVTFSWNLKNQGLNPANGYMEEGVYLSEDTVKDINDILMGSWKTNIYLAPGAQVAHSANASLTGVSLRDYHVLVYADQLNNIAETNDSNNVASSFQTMKVAVPQLQIGILISKNLQRNKETYYRIDIPNSQVGESLLISLKGDSAKGNNEIYLRLGEVPTRAVYDYAYGQPYQGNQEIVVPALKAGTYYLMVYGSTTVATVQPITLLANILHFEIRNVNANQGGNNGQVTLQLNGSKLGNVTSVRLRNGTTTILADSVRIADPTKLYVTFNLINTALGAYDIVAQNATGDTATLANGFTVVNGSTTNLVTNVVAPPSARLTTIISMTIQYTNAGNTDIVNPVLQITSAGGAPIAFNPSGLVDNTQTLTLNLQELNGPVGRLRPGASGTITVYAKTTTMLGFVLSQSND